MWLDPKIPSVAVRISSMGELLGTGFIVGVPSESIKGREWTYVVTAHHVLRGQLEPAVEIPDPWGEHRLSPPLLINDWRHPFEAVDLAIIPAPALGHNHLTVGLEDNILPPGVVPELGGTVHYVGIFGPLETPMARAGTIGALEVPIKRPNPNGTEYDYISHLIDCRSYNGFSGSPCFTQRLYGVANQEFEPVIPLDSLPGGLRPETTQIYCENILAGMLTAHVSDEPDDGSASRYGVGVMLRSDEIWRALMTDEAKAERREWDEVHEKKKEAEGPSLEELGGKGPGRSRDEVLSDFERISGPLRGQNRDRKPKA